MKLLAIDTSTENASIALLFENKLAHVEQGNQKTHAQFLLPMIDQLMRDNGASMNELDAIIFGCGPGSFTGLRIACSVAKGLAYAHDLDLIPVSSLASIAWSVRQQELLYPGLPVLAVLDARMHEMYWAYFSDQGNFQAEERVNAVKDLSVSNEQGILLAGVGIDEYWSDFPDELKSRIIRRLCVYPSAEAMIQLVQATGIKAISAAQAQPVYVRNQVTYGDSRG